MLSERPILSAATLAQEVDDTKEILRVVYSIKIFGWIVHIAIFMHM